MLALDILYIAIATVGVMILLQVVTFVGVKILYPPEPQVIYRDRIVEVPQVQQQRMPLTQSVTQVQLPEYVPASGGSPPPAPPKGLPPPIKTREDKNGTNVPETQQPSYDERAVPTSTSLRMDSELPFSLQETNPREL